jgi:hypothetical protein
MGDPLVNASTYHLNSLSPCANAASAVTGFADDYDGNPRGASWDIGADEIGGTQLATPPPAGVVGTGGGAAGGPPIISTASLVNGAVSLPYNAPVTCTGGSGPYAWSIISGALPPGITLDTSSTTNSAALNGTPTTGGSYNFTVQVSGGGIGTQALTLNIASVPIDPAPNDGGGGGCSTDEWQALGLAFALLALIVWAARQANQKTA